MVNQSSHAGGDMIRSSYQSQWSVIFEEKQPSQTVLPLFQPLRLWTSRTELKPLHKEEHRLQGSMRLGGFSMKGGFVSNNHGGRSLILAGKIVKNESIEE